MPENEGAIMNVRSSMGFKRKLMLINTQGWIDSDFYSNEDNDGNIGVNIYNFGDKAQTIEKGERIAQIMFIGFGVTDNDDEQQKEKRVGGTGSTGTK
jgi:dUTP pyrophosphatase